MNAVKCIICGLPIVSAGAMCRPSLRYLHAEVQRGAAPAHDAEPAPQMQAAPPPEGEGAVFGRWL